MPLLNGHPVAAATIAAITHAVVLPEDAPDGRVFVQFVVTKESEVSQPQIANGVRADVDAAVVAATRKLPTFTPGKHRGRAVPVRITLPISSAGQQPRGSSLLAGPAGVRFTGELERKL